MNTDEIKNEILKKILTIFMILFFLFLLFRSSIFVLRIINDSKKASFVGFIQKIDPCINLNSIKNREDLQLFLYKKIGARCP